MKLLYKKHIICLIVLGLGTFYSFAQIKGIVVDNRQNPIPDASVQISGTSQGTKTDSTGIFEIPVAQKYPVTLHITAVGYQPIQKHITINDSDKLQTVTLQQDNLNLHEVVVSASRYGMERKKAPVIVNVLTPKLFEATQAVAMSETLNYQPGVRLENNCQNCGFSQVRLNGLQGAYSQILINSRSIFSALNSVYGLDQIPTSMIDRIEIVRSGGSALFGANAIAGTINIITRDPIENDWQIKSTNSLIDGKSWDNTIDFNTSYVDNDLSTGATFYGMHRNREAYDANSDGFSDMTTLKNLTFGTKVFYKPSERDKLTLEISALNEFRRGGDQLDIAPHFTDITEQLRTNSLITGFTFDRFSADFRRKYSFYASAQNTKRESYYGGLGGSRTRKDSIAASNAYGNTKDQAMVVGAQFINNFQNDILIAGIEYAGNNTKDNIAGYRRVIDQQSNAVGSYLQYEWKILENLKSLIGARYDLTNIVGKYQLADIIRNSNQNFGTFSPRLTVLYDINDLLQFRGGYARGFRAPQAFNEDMHVTSIGGRQVFTLIGKDLETEYSNAYTASLNISKNFASTQTSLLIEGFFTDLHNPFVSVMTSQSDALRIEEMRNGTGATVYGANIEFNIAPSSEFTFQTGGTVQRSTYKEEQLLFEGANESGNILSKKFVRTPNIYGYLNTNYNASEDLRLDLTGIFTGSMIVPHNISTSEVKLKESPNFLEMNLRASYMFHVKETFNIEVFAGVQNIFNAFQKDLDIGALRDSKYIYGPSRPRTYSFGIKIGHFH